MKISKEQEYKKVIRKHLGKTVDSGFLPELGKHRSGKVRDVHYLSNNIGDPMIMIASDRISCFDHVLSRRIPFKGRVLNLLNQWAFENTKDIVGNACLESPHPNVIIQKHCRNVMVECVVRGYMWGSLAAQYELGVRNFCGIHLRDGLLRYQRLDEPLFTPTTKAEHDAPLTMSDVENMLGREKAEQLYEISLKLYKRGAELAKKAGLILVDTKYEFGIDDKGELLLIDEANTPDSSRYCSIKEYEKFQVIKERMGSGRFRDVNELLEKQPSLKIKEMSKQFIRDVLVSRGFGYESTGEIPELSDDDIIEVAYRYIDLYESVTGKTFDFPSSNPRFEMLEDLKDAGYIKGGMALIFAGSDSDMSHVDNIRKELEVYGIPSKIRICSAHKQPGLCEDIIKYYNISLEPVVIINVAGGTDALSGVISFHSIHPVISCPPRADEHHSSINNPPGSSNSVILNPKNVARHVAQILGHYNASFHEKLLQLNEEKLDSLKKSDEQLR